jgi:hypothetical protein
VLSSDSEDDTVFATARVPTVICDAIRNSIVSLPVKFKASNSIKANANIDSDQVEEYYLSIISNIVDKYKNLESDNKDIQLAFEKYKIQAANHLKSLEEYDNERNGNSLFDELRDLSDSSEDETGEFIPKCGTSGCDGRGNTRFPGDLTKKHRVAHTCPNRIRPSPTQSSPETKSSALNDITNNYKQKEKELLAKISELEHHVLEKYQDNARFGELASENDRLKEEKDALSKELLGLRKDNQKTGKIIEQLKFA